MSAAPYVSVDGGLPGRVGGHGRPVDEALHGGHVEDDATLLGARVGPAVLGHVFQGKLSTTNRALKIEISLYFPKSCGFCDFLPRG